MVKLVIIDYESGNLRSVAKALESTGVRPLITGDPEELGGQLAALARRFAHFTVFGGCCGTDLRHIAAIARQLPIAA